jgi:hypothetical protein
MENEVGATGAVVRDEMEGFLAASNNCIPHVASAATAEARVLKDGGSDYNSDCLEVIQTMHDAEASTNYEECNFLAVSDHVIFLRTALYT